MIIRPSFTVLSGAAVGLVAGAAVYGAVTSSATPTTSQPTKAVVAARPASVAPCAKGQKLEDGVCVVHIVRTVVIPAPAAALVPTTSGAPEASGNQGTGSSASHDDATKDASDATETGDDATETGDDATETGDDATASSAKDDSAGQTGSDDSGQTGSDDSAAATP